MTSAPTADDKAVIFDELKSMLGRYVPPLDPRPGSSERYDLWSNKQIEIDGRRRDGIYFGGTSILKRHVTLHLMPVYTHLDLREQIEPDVLTLLDGKSCFHVTSVDPRLLEGLSHAIEMGFNRYRSEGWV